MSSSASNSANKLLIPGIILVIAIAIYAFYPSPNAEINLDSSLQEATSTLQQTEASDDLADVVTTTETATETEVETLEQPSSEVTSTSTASSENVSSQSVSPGTTTSSVVSKDAEAVVSDVEVVSSEIAEDIIFIEGKSKDYLVKFPSDLSKGPMLVEFFSYMCPHCNNFEPTVKLWVKQKPDSVELLKVPVSFGRATWRLAAKSYYIAEELGVTDAFTVLMFKTIHSDNNPPQTEADLSKIFAKLGISNKQFSDVSKSFNVDAKLRKADYLIKKYKVAGVPYFLINFKYEAAEASYASQEALFRLWNYLPAVDFE